MLDLKNCPFCGGKATFAKTTKGWKVECEGRWGTCTINARTHYQPTKGQAVAAWNRRALQAVGPEPAVAVKPLEWRKPDPENIMDHDDCQLVATGLGGQYAISERQLVRIKSPDNMGFLLWGAEDAFTFTEHLSVKAAKTAAEADYASRIRSALVAIPPAERVVEALPPTREYVDRIVRIFRDRPADDTSAVVLQDYARAALAAKDGRS